LLKALPEEDDAELSATGTAREEFRQMVRDAMLSEVTLATTIRVGPKVKEQRIERHSLIGWCLAFVKPGPWRSIRDKLCWCRYDELPGGELVLRVAIRHGVFTQVKADRRLVVMKENTFTRRAKRYGIGTSSRDERPHGRSAIVLHDELVADLTASMPAE